MGTSNLKTWIFLLVVWIFTLIVGDFIGGRQGLLAAFLALSIFTFSAFFFGQEWLLWTYGAKKVEGVDSHKLNDLSHQLASKADITAPSIYIAPTMTPNAFIASGFANSSIILTEGLLKILTRAELEAVLAHEMVQIKNKETFLMTLVATLASLIMMGSTFINWVIRLGQKNDNPHHPKEALCYMSKLFFAPLAALPVRLTFKKDFKFKADAASLEWGGSSQVLASAIRKIYHYSLNFPFAATESTGHVFFVNPNSNTTLSKIFETHPSAQERIKKLIGRNL